MRVLVTGGAGFIGSHIVDHLIQGGHDPHVLDNLSTGSRDNLPPHVPFHHVDVRDKTAVENVLKQVQPDVVCHQAAQMSVSRSVREPHYDAEVNILGLLNVLAASAQSSVKRFVFASSGGVLYGDVESPVNENFPANPVSPYGIAKLTGELYLRFFARESNMLCVALRYANVYGPRQNPHGEAGVVAIFCTKMLQSQAPTINGDGKYVRDYVYVDDVARGNLLAMTTPLPDRFTPFNLGTGLPTDVNQLEHLIRASATEILAKLPAPATIPPALFGPPRAGDLRSNLVDYSQATGILHWQPRVAINSGIASTVKWFATKLLN